jgi:hypothetical protein
MIKRVWKKPGRCEGNGGNCVEVDHKTTPGTVYVRDSKAGDEGSIFEFDYDEWEAHLAAVKAGEYDLPQA